MNRDLRIVACSDAFLRARRTSRQAILGRHIYEIFPDNPNDPAAAGNRNLRASFDLVLRHGVVDAMDLQRYEVRKPESEGGGFEERYWSTVNLPVPGPDGAVQYVIHRVEDVTDSVLLRRQGTEQQARAMEMEAEIYSRTREAADASMKLNRLNDELTRLSARIQELEQSQSRFFANVSHELRTPLTLILAPVERLLSGSKLESGIRKDLMLVQRNARQLQRHVNDLLDISRLDAGAAAIRYGRFDLATLARRVAASFEALAAEQEVRFEVRVPEALPAEADADKVERILLNLLSNAFLFTPPGGTVRLSLEEVSGCAEIRVADTGPGVPADQRELVFEPYRQADSGVAQRCGGGLGLAIAKEFAALHEGAAGVTDAPGGGAIFFVDLPLAAPRGISVGEVPEAKEHIDAGRELVLQLTQAPPQDRSRSHILVVEDNPDMMTFLADTLGQHYWITRAAGGHEGLQRAMAETPDLIVTDVMMPDLGGDQMVAEIRKHCELDGVPVVVITARSDDEMRRRILREGAQAFIEKPFPVEDLLACVCGLLTHRERSQRKLRDTEERFRMAQEMSPDAFAIFKPVRDEQGIIVDFRTTYINQAAAALWGGVAEQFVGQRFLRDRMRDDAGPWFEALTRVAETGSSHVMENSRHREEGGPLWLRGTMVRIGEDVATWVQDLTERRAAEFAALSWQRAFDASDLAIALGDAATGTFLAVNESFARQRGYTAAELAGQPARMFWLEEELALARELLATADREGHATVEVHNRRRDGSVFPVRIDMTTIRDETGKPETRLAFAQDLTSQKEAEARVAQLHAELERRVMERTSELEAAKRELEAFSYSVSHDLRAPLRGIDGWSLALMEDYAPLLDEQARKYIERVRDEAQRMGRLIDALLQLSRVTRSAMERETVNLSALAQAVAGRLEEENSDRTIEFVIEPGLEAVGDPHLLEIALNNLMGNAAKFTRTRPCARIEIGRSGASGECAFFVRDNGVGFDMAYASSLFAPFQRLHNESEFTGTGIGLATVQRIVLRHGGRIWADARPGEGARFSFTLANGSV